MITTIINLIIACSLIYLEIVRQQEFRKEVAEVKKMRENFAADVSFQNQLVKSLLKDSYKETDYLVEEIKKMIK
jgi:hypothetical protein